MMNSKYNCSKIRLGPFEVNSATSLTLLNSIRKDMDAGKKWLACLNVYSYMLALEDAQFRSSLQCANYLVPDGIGILLAAKLRGKNIRQRTTGYDVFKYINKVLNDRSGKVFYLGSSQETLSLIKKKSNAEWPNIDVVGLYSPPFKADFTDDEIADMVKIINVAMPDVLWVGLSAPKQEKWIQQALPQLNVKFSAGIGAVFEYYTGNEVRAPWFLRSIGLEWLIRFIDNPKKMYERVIKIPIFLIYIAMGKV